jgi:Chromo (CHRromatin Organisation MOdifier) domain
VLQQQIADFRAYRRQRFSLFRRGPLVEETTISGNIKSLLRFLGYLHYEQSGELQQCGVVALDMSVFTLPNISALVLSYVEWLEQRRGRKPRAADDDHTFQPVSCTTLSSYLNGLVSIVKFQLRHDIHLRDPLLDQLRNLRSQAESYSMTQKGFEKVHPQWCSWRELQIAREKCRAAFDQRVDEKEAGRSYLLHLREMCLLCLLTICPPPRVSIVRLLEWNKTLVQGDKGRWMVDLTDVSHAATRHKTHKRKGALQLPLPSLLFPYLAQLQRLAHGGVVFPGRSASSFLTPTSFTGYVKTTFGKYTDSGRSPNPSLLRSIFTTWLYGIQYDTEDAFLQQIKASSARWKAHSEQIAATVYNRDLIYQHREFAVLLRFCELYSSRFSYDKDANGVGNDAILADEDDGATAADDAPKPTRSGRKRRSTLSARNIEQTAREPKRGTSVPVYVVEELVDVRVTKQGVKQVQVRWEGYLRCTWEPYESIREQLPSILATLEASLASEVEAEGDEVRGFVDGYIATHHIDSSYRWVPDRVVALEHAAITHDPPIKLTVDRLQKRIMELVDSTSQ